MEEQVHVHFDVCVRIGRRPHYGLRPLLDHVGQDLHARSTMWPSRFCRWDGCSVSTACCLWRDQGIPTTYGVGATPAMAKLGRRRKVLLPLVAGLVQATAFTSSARSNKMRSLKLYVAVVVAPRGAFVVARPGPLSLPSAAVFAVCPTVFAPVSSFLAPNFGG